MDYEEFVVCCGEVLEVLRRMGESKSSGRRSVSGALRTCC